MRLVKPAARRYPIIEMASRHLDPSFRPYPSLVPVLEIQMSADLVIIGLGYVGLPLAREATLSGLSVVGFDITR